ncbi:AAA family ATPase [Sphingorhabdus sp. IMCC26285]|uniref:Chromosomal replication initiator protein DnaA n=1 Tax=Sphingorhabdus profundilacus TaxID=2509718 RepID=A0A6I4M5M6_9SPHN|nr:DnaA/Hda family protein [Sphingorhabdus profundilacus]MVZ97918.1 AAA family ATPase [Sphingorhabdus profundilacus]
MEKTKTHADIRKANAPTGDETVVIYAQTNLGIPDEQSATLREGNIVSNHRVVLNTAKRGRLVDVKLPQNMSLLEKKNIYTPVVLSQIGWNERRARQFVRDIESIAEAPTSLRSKLVDLIIRGIAGSHLMVAKETQKVVAMTEMIHNIVAAQSAVEALPVRSALDPRLTFANFVCGPTNVLAVTAAERVATKDKPLFNPLYLQAATGQGKTHLMHAIGHAYAQVNPDAQIIYMSAEKFMMEFVTAMRRKEVMEFKARLRAVDVLLIDDIQFMIGKVSTQEEFLHTIDAIIGAGKRLVVAADRAPQALDGVDQRILSRLSMGLVADIQPPDLELRRAILNQRLASMPDTQVGEDVIKFLARTISRNVRELEGGLNKLVAYAQLTGQPITRTLAEEQLKDILPAAATNQTLGRVEVVITGVDQPQQKSHEAGPWESSMPTLSKPEAIAAAQENGDPEANVRAYARKAGRQLDAWAGELLGAIAIKDRFNISPQMLSQYRKKGHVIAFPNGRTKFRYPEEQFRERAILPDTEPVLRLAGSPISAWHWLVHMAPTLGHKRPIDLLWTGEREAVIEAAELQFGQ